MSSHREDESPAPSAKPPVAKFNLWFVKGTAVLYIVGGFMAAYVLREKHAVEWGLFAGTALVMLAWFSRFWARHGEGRLAKAMFLPAAILLLLLPHVVMDGWTWLQKPGEFTAELGAFLGFGIMCLWMARVLQVLKRRAVAVEAGA